MCIAAYTAKGRLLLFGYRQIDDVREMAAAIRANHLALGLEPPKLRFCRMPADFNAHKYGQVNLLTGCVRLP